MWDSDSISSSQLNDLRHAAERAWGEDTRHERFTGHPQPSHGQCFVTSAWLAQKLGGHVGTKNGHYFWVSPDKSHVVDLTGDWFAYPPIHESRHSPEDEPHHHTWRPGPTMFKRADHPLYKGFRVLPAYSDHQRANTFSRRADAALRGHRVADQLGDAYPGDTPQKQEDYDLSAPMPFLHDELGPDSTEGGNGEYQFVVANGQIHVSPEHSHEELIRHTGQHPESEGPMAVGYVNVNQRNALWMVETNMSMRGLHKMLKEYSDTVGWKFEGMVGSDGSHLHDDFGLKMSMWYKIRKDGHALLAKTPFEGAEEIHIQGKTAYVPHVSDALMDWADDFGYNLKVAEYPGGGDMLDKMKPKENLDIYNRGDTDFQPERSNPDMDLGDNLKCGWCSRRFDTEEELRLHTEAHQPLDSEELPDGHFPQLDDFDAPLPFRRRQPSPNWGETIATTVIGQGKGQEPKDMIEAAIPFIYDVKADQIHIGYAGQHSRDVKHRDGGTFTPGGILEGYYEPGGKIILIGSSMMAISQYHFAQLWYSRFPQMEISDIEMETPDGKTHKLSAATVGQRIRTLVASDQAAHNAYRALTQAGGKVYAVGGAIRDVLQQREPKDLDLMVAGLPAEQVRYVLSNLPGHVNTSGHLDPNKDNDHNARFGVFHYFTNGQKVEVALPRQDKYEVSGRGKGVITVDHNLPVEQDLLRRDFTGNSMAVALDNGDLVDPYGGARDLEANVLRTTHPDSFREDPTRLVRALVAHSRFGLQPDERTRQEMAANGHLLRDESPDALNQVLDKLFASRNPASAIRLAKETQVLPHLFPEVAEHWDFDQNNPNHRYVLGDHLVNVLDNVARASSDPDLRLAALYHDVGKPVSAWVDPATGQSHYYLGPNGEGANHESVGARVNWSDPSPAAYERNVQAVTYGANHETVGARMAADRMHALNYSRARITRVRDLVQNHMFPAFNTSRGARRFLNRVGDYGDDLLTLRQADMSGKGQTPAEMEARTSVNQMRELVGQVRQQQQPTDLATIPVNGNDLIAMGVSPGPAIGNILRSLVNDTIEDPALGNRDALLERARTYVNALPST